MCKTSDLPLSLKSDTFNALCTDFDQVLRSTLTGMEDTEQDVAEINVKVKISLTEDSAPDFSVAGGRQTRSITKPKFDHTVSAVIQKKEKKTGTLSGNYELVWDRETCMFVMRPIDNGQVTLFDENMKDKPTEGKVVDAEFKEVPALEAGKPLGLPGDVAEATEEIGFDKLHGYAGKEFCCEWTEDEKSVVIRCLNDGEVLLDAEKYPELELEKHIGHDIICVAFEKDGEDVVAITCDTCDMVLYMAQKPVRKIDTETPYGWLRQFAGVDMKILESMGIYTVRTGSNKVVLSSGTNPDATFYVPAEKLAPHVGHTIVCVIYGDKDAEANISIECETCNEVLFSMDCPDYSSGETDSEEYPYEAPEGEESGETA